MECGISEFTEVKIQIEHSVIGPVPSLTSYTERLPVYRGEIKQSKRRWQGSKISITKHQGAEANCLSLKYSVKLEFRRDLGAEDDADRV